MIVDNTTDNIRQQYCFHANSNGLVTLLFNKHWYWNIHQYYNAWFKEYTGRYTWYNYTWYNYAWYNYTWYNCLIKKYKRWVLDRIRQQIQNSKINNLGLPVQQYTSLSGGNTCVSPLIIPCFLTFVEVWKCSVNGSFSLLQRNNPKIPVRVVKYYKLYLS